MADLDGMQRKIVRSSMRAAMSDGIGASFYSMGISRSSKKRCRQNQHRDCK